ncbi:DUF4145 domain-containing protein [Rhizobium leguminosarum]|uniref:DUF4145 domain-containing protein n=1 Tax=Rhizobium TaxID=379 RepID=UPI00103118BE|nr:MULTISPECIES: DUF4145 domain-containing protein [Rhizobium]NEI11054.1 DUF4145 domain-containing protein [Rhizobium ruizarguesonis]TAY05790.1 DUF4145 domain-containing protein [Rhizobium leguminosarum]TBB80607.1 DUF4145 domain-containing protein [Rhizobium ruizarguesonis]
MERKHWKRSYSYFPQFVCPRCHKGNLTATKDRYKREPKHVTNDLRDHDMQGEESEGRFIALLSCNNRLCGEIVAVAGDYVSHATIDKGPDGGLEQFWDDTFRPTSMHPAPSIITWPKSLDELPKMHLMVSFELFWVDAAACASRLRIFIETLLDQLGVGREGIKRNGKKGMLDLSERIDELDKVKPGHKSALDALRHVGNFGSHEGEPDFEDLVVCYDILETTLVELIEDKRAKLDAEIAAIIDRKGKPRS